MMTRENWKIMKAKMNMRRRREKAFLATCKDFLTVAAGVGVVMLLCGFCWIGGM